MKNILAICFLLTGCFSSIAQLPVDSVLAQVERNNPNLIAFRHHTEAAVAQQKTGLWPSNPVTGFNYLSSNPRSIGSRTDLSIVQSFEFPTVYFHKGKIADYRIEQAEIEFLLLKNNVIYEAYMTCLELIYQNMRLQEHKERARVAQQIADSYRSMFDQGEVSVLDFHKASSNAVNAALNLAAIETERNSLLAKLTALNGGQIVLFTDTIFPVVVFDENFDAWFSAIENNNPMLAWQAKEVAIAENQIQLRKAQLLPNFHTGYMSETVAGQKFQGVTLGMSIPLWEGLNTVSHARKNAFATQTMAEAANHQYRLQMQALHAKAMSMQLTLITFESQMNVYNNRSFLIKSFEAGEISLTQFLLELQFYYQSSDRLLELRYMANSVMAELCRFLL